MSYWGNEYMPGMRAAAENMVNEMVDLLAPNGTIQDCDRQERPVEDLKAYVRHCFNDFDDEWEPDTYLSASPAGGYEFDILDFARELMTEILEQDWA